MDALSPSLPIPSEPVAEWPAVCTRVRVDREMAGVSIEAAAELIDVEADDIAGFEAGDPQRLGIYELDMLASQLGTSLGGWLYGDEKPMFRGGRDQAACDEAVVLARQLMSEFLAAESLAA